MTQTFSQILESKEFELLLGKVYKITKSWTDKSTKTETVKIEFIQILGLYEPHFDKYHEKLLGCIWTDGKEVSDVLRINDIYRLYSFVEKDFTESTKEEMISHVTQFII